MGSQPVAPAGHITANKGVLQRIDNNSGHYQLPRAVGLQVVHQLQSQGVHVDPSVHSFIQEPDQLRTRAYPDSSVGSWAMATRREGRDSERLQLQQTEWQDRDVLDIG